MDLLSKLAALDFFGNFREVHWVFFIFLSIHTKFYPVKFLV